MPLHSYTISNTPNGDRALSVMVREFDANHDRNEMRKHFTQVGSVDRISIITRGGWGRHHAFVDFHKAGCEPCSEGTRPLVFDHGIEGCLSAARLAPRPARRRPRICGKRTDPVIGGFRGAGRRREAARGDERRRRRCRLGNRPRAAAVAAGMAAAACKPRRTPRRLRRQRRRRRRRPETVDAMQSRTDAAAAPRAKTSTLHSPTSASSIRPSRPMFTRPSPRKETRGAAWAAARFFSRRRSLRHRQWKAARPPPSPPGVSPGRVGRRRHVEDALQHRFWSAHDVSAFCHRPRTRFTTHFSRISMAACSHDSRTTTS